MNYLLKTFISTSFIVSMSSIHALPIPISNQFAAKTWIGNTNDWFQVDNWNSIGVPVAGDVVTINTVAGQYPLISSGLVEISTVTLNGDSTLTVTNGARLTTSGLFNNIGNAAGSNSQLIISNSTLDFSPGNIGNAGNGTLSILNGATFNSSNLTLGSIAGSVGTVEVDNAIWNSNSPIGVGFDGNGIVRVTNGGQIQGTIIQLGTNIGNGTGSLTIDGQNSLINANVDVGLSSVGNLTMQNGSLITSTIINIGADASGIGTFVINGSGTTLQNTSTVNLANNGIGNLVIQNGGLLSTQNVGVASATGAVGTILIDGAGSSLQATQAVNLALSGTGNLTIQNGGLLTAQSFAIGEDLGSSGAAIINGASSSLQIDQEIVVGNNGTANLTIQNGGQVNSSNSFIANSASGNGSATIQGAGSIWSTPLLTIGEVGVGDLTIQNSGSLLLTEGLFLATRDNSQGTLDLQGTSGSRGLLQTPALERGLGTASQVVFDGGIIRATTNNNNFFVGFLSNELQFIGEGLFLDSNGFSIANEATSNFTGTGGLTKLGAGAFTLNGTNPYTGLTFVNAGTLVLNGSTGGGITVNPNGRLEGNGSAAGAITVNGVIAPGNSIGTLSAASYISNPGSTYEVEINPAGQSDLIDVTGTATINGGTVSVIKATGNYPAPMRYTIVNADGGVTGTYDSLSQGLPFLNLILAYDSNHVYLDLLRNTTPFAFYANTPNEVAVATSVEALGVGNPVYDSLVSLNSPNEVPPALNGLSGEIHASVLSTFIDESRYSRHAILNHLRSKPLLDTFQLLDNGWYLWNSDFGAWGNFDETNNTASVSRQTGGLFIGADKHFNEFTQIGVLGGYSRSQINIDARSSRANSDNYHLGVYGKTVFNHLALRAGGVYTWQDLDISRSVAFGTLSNYLTSDYGVHTGQIFAEAGNSYSYQNVALEPFIGIAYVDVDSNRWREAGGAAALIGKGQESVFYSTLGLNQNALLSSTETLQTQESLQIGWQHAYSGVTPFASMNFIGGSLPLGISGAPIAEDALLIDAGFTLTNPVKHVNLRLSYIGQLASSVQDHGIAALINWQFA